MRARGKHLSHPPVFLLLRTLDPELRHLGVFSPKKIPISTELTCGRMNRRKADFRFAYKFLEDEL
jgi:hypothetical protein